MAVLSAGLESAFERFGGVPWELLFDQMRAVVRSDGRVSSSTLVLNAEFLCVALHWAFHSRGRADRTLRAPKKCAVCAIDTTNAVHV